MDKNELVDLMNEIFKPLGYKKKGNYWISIGDTLTKSIDLQKSNFSRQYYINYGFIINHLELTTKEHISYRLSGVPNLLYLLDLESNVNNEERLSELKKIISDKIVCTLENINTEDELLEEIRKLPHLNAIPGVVKIHYNLPL